MVVAKTKATRVSRDQREGKDTARLGRARTFCGPFGCVQLNSVCRPLHTAAPHVCHLATPVDQANGYVRPFGQRDTPQHILCRFRATASTDVAGDGLCVKCR